MSSKSEIAPTMIIPSGTEIQIDVHGQLSVRTPGNLVIQNSGHYGEIESVEGSIRIEANAEVEAVAVKCAETCYVQGSLTSWKVKARSIQLEEQAQARIVLQETESIEIGKNARLVGNFHTEKELFLLFSRFAQQLRSLPFYFDRKDGPAALPRQEVSPESVSAQHQAQSQPPASSPTSNRILEVGQDLPDELFFSLVLLERELKDESYGANSIRVLQELVKLLKSRDLDALRHTQETLFARLADPSEDAQRARELIEGYFAGLEIGEEAPDATST